MGIWSKFFGVLLLFGAGFLAGYHMGAPNPNGEGIVDVKLVNESGGGIKDLRLTHDHGYLEVKDIPEHGSQIVKFYSPRETSYRIELTFDDGKILESGIRHIESRQNVIETIRENELMPEFHVLK
jgi:hypothetical protein